MYKVDVYLRVRRAVMVDGMSIREASRVFGLHRDTVRKMLAFSVPPGYLRQSPPKRPKLEPFTGVIDRILEDDLGRPRKQRHTAKRIFDRLRDEYRFDGQYTIVKDYVREHRRQSREMFVPLSHSPGHTQCDFGEALVLHHVSHLGLRRGVGRSAATIPVGECGGALLPIGRQNTPHVAFAHSQDLGRLTYRHLICQQAVEHLKSCLLLLSQRQCLHSRTFSLTS